MRKKNLSRKELLEYPVKYLQDYLESIKKSQSKAEDKKIDRRSFLKGSGLAISTLALSYFTSFEKDKFFSSVKAQSSQDSRPEYVPDDAEDITDYGAVRNPDDPDDGTYSTNRQAIIDAMDAAGSEGAIYVPSGTFFFGEDDGNSWIQVGVYTSATGVSIYGDGPGKSILGITEHHSDGEIASLFRYDGAAYDSTSHTIKVRGMQFDGQSQKLPNLEADDVGQICFKIEAPNSDITLDLEECYIRNIYNSVVNMDEGSLSVNFCTFEHIAIDLDNDADGEWVDHALVPSPRSSNNDTVNISNSVFKLIAGNVVDPGGDGTVNVDNCWCEGIGSGFAKINSVTLNVSNVYARMHTPELDSLVVDQTRPRDGRVAIYSSQGAPTTTLDNVEFVDTTEQAFYLNDQRIDENTPARDWKVAGDVVKLNNIGFDRTDGGSAVFRESGTEEPFRWDMEDISVHGIASTHEVFNTPIGGGTIKSLSWEGASELGDTGNTTINSVTENGAQVNPTVPSESDVGAFSGTSPGSTGSTKSDFNLKLSSNSSNPNNYYMETTGPIEVASSDKSQNHSIFGNIAAGYLTDDSVEYSLSGLIRELKYEENLDFVVDGEQKSIDEVKEICFTGAGSSVSPSGGKSGTSDFEVPNDAINVKEDPYNASGDGKTDDTAAIQQAFDNAGDGDVVYFPEGTYMISPDGGGGPALEVTSAQAGVTVAGEPGEDSSRLLLDSNAIDDDRNTRMLGLDGSEVLQDIEVRDLTLDGDRKGDNSDPYYSSGGIQLYPGGAGGGHSILLENLYIKNVSGTAVRFIEGGDDNSEVHINRVTTENCGRHGFGVTPRNEVSKGEHSILVENSVSINHGGTGVDNSRGSVRIQNMYIDDCDQGNKNTRKTKESWWLNVNIRNCEIPGYRQNIAGESFHSDPVVHLDNVLVSNSNSWGYRFDGIISNDIGTIAARDNNHDGGGSAGIIWFGNSSTEGTADTIISTGNNGDGMYFSTDGSVTVDNYYYENNETGATGGDTRSLNIASRNNNSGPEIDVPEQNDVGAWTG